MGLPSEPKEVVCEECEKPLTSLGEMPGMGEGTATVIYWCRTCDRFRKFWRAAHVNLRA